MSTTIKQKNVSDYIAELHQRINRLETGGKPLVKIANPADLSFNLPADNSATLTVTLNWSETEVVAVPHGICYFTFYIDTDTDLDYRWPDGWEINAFDHEITWHFDFVENNSVDFKETKVLILVKNLDTIAHDYYFYTTFSYVGGQTGAEGEQ